MDPQTFEWASKAGVVGVCIFVIWLGWKREERAAKSFETLNERSNAVQQETVKQLTALTETTRALHGEIRERPCVSQDPWNGVDRRK